MGLYFPNCYSLDHILINIDEILPYFNNVKPSEIFVYHPFMKTTKFYTLFRYSNVHRVLIVVTQN